MSKQQDIVEWIKYMLFLCVCLTFMFSFTETVNGRTLAKSPDDSFPLLFCFSFTILLDMIYRKKENYIFNSIEILFGILLLPLGVIVYRFKDEGVLSIIVLSFSSVILFIKIINLCSLLFLKSKSKNVNRKEEK